MSIGLGRARIERACYFCTDATPWALFGRPTDAWPNKAVIPCCLRCAGSIGERAGEERPERSKEVGHAAVPGTR